MSMSSKVPNNFQSRGFFMETTKECPYLKIAWVRLPMGANFRLGLKKIPSSVPRQSTGLRTGPVSQGDGAAV